MNLLELLLEQNAFTRKIPKGSAGYGSPTGKFKKRNAQIFIADLNDAANQLKYDITSTIEELMHLAARHNYYTDKDFADFVHKTPDLRENNIPDRNVAGFDKPLVYPLDRKDLTKQEKKNLENEGHLAWSYYWHGIIRRECFNKLNWSDYQTK